MDQALGLLAGYGDQSKVLAGGQRPPSSPPAAIEDEKTVMVIGLGDVRGLFRGVDSG